MAESLSLSLSSNTTFVGRPVLIIVLDKALWDRDVCVGSLVVNVLGINTHGEVKETRLGRGM